MKNAPSPAGDGVPLVGIRPAGPTAGLAASGPPQRASQRWKAFALLVATYFSRSLDFTIVICPLDTEFPAPKGPGYIVRYSVERIGGVGPWVPASH